MKILDIMNQIDFEAEINYEQDMIQNGYDKTMKKALTDKVKHMDHIQNFTTKLIKPFAEALEITLKDLTGKRGVVNPLTKAEEFITVNQMAYVTVYMCVQSVMKESKLNSVALGLARQITNTIKNNITTNKKLSEEEKQSGRDKVDAFKTVGLILATLFFDTFGIYTQPKMNGSVMLKDENDFVIMEEIDKSPLTYTKYFGVIQQKSKGTKYELYVKSTPSLDELLANNLEDLAWRSFANKPMLRPPVPWSISGQNGGYYSKELKKYLSKAHSAVSKTDKERSIASREVINAVNAIQATPWRVNQEVLSVMEKLSIDIPATLKKVFPANVAFVEKMKNRLSRKEFLALGKEEKDKIRDHSTKVKRAIEKKSAKESIDRDRVTALSQAHQLMNEPNVYFPYDVDYRGRIYSMAMSGLNPQGSDLGKGLIQFAIGYKIETASGEKWLKINMANLMGFDKAKLWERVEYVNDRETELRKIVHDPIKNIEWHYWDKPIQGLACAIEYVKYLKDPEQKLHIHVQLDGLCNGVQNLAAISLDSEVSPHLGLIDTEERGDIYQFVCDGVIRKIEAILNKQGKNHEWANHWKDSGLLTRKLTKKPVMTRSYSATLYGIKEGVREFILSEEKADCFEDLILESNWMGKLIWDTMNAEISGPMAVMEYFQKVAEVIGKAGKPLKWFAPSGMYCHYAPRKQKPVRIKVRINMKQKLYQMLESTDVINGAKLTSSVAPNIVHSFDASHLVMTTNRCLEKGVKDFAFVHDSFGTHPDAVADLLECTKEAWIEMYDQNQLERLYQEWCLSYPECEIPHWRGSVNMGTLNIEDVRNSDFFFA